MGISVCACSPRVMTIFGTQDVLLRWVSLPTSTSLYLFFPTTPVNITRAPNTSTSMAGDNNHAAGTASRLPNSMADSLTFASPEEALQSLAAQSESLALGLAQELDGMLGGGSSAGGASGASSGTKSSGSGPLPPLPDSIVKAAAAAAAAASSSESTSNAAADNKHNFDDSDAYLYSTSDGSKLQTALVCSESILSSLTKVASGGSKASTEMRALENERRQVDDEADAIAAALRLRQLASGAADALTGRRYADAVKMVAEFDRIMEATANLGGGGGGDAADTTAAGGGETKEGGDDDEAEPLPTPLQIAGTHTHSSYAQTRTVLRQSILERYEQAITNSNIHSISELTPLLGMLDLADKGVGLYLRYSQAELSKHMSLAKEAEVEGKQRQLDAQLQAQHMGTEARISRAEQRRRDEARESLGKRVTVCTKLAKVYNAAVTHLRHHLPMVTYALGVADGDAALVQLVHLEVEKRAVQLIRDYAQERQLGEYESRAERVASMIEDRYVNGMGVEELLQGAAGVDASAYGPLQMMGISSGEVNPDAARAQLEQNDCGFRAEVGRLADVDAMMDEAALLLQHTESYERFVRHGCDEVNKARKLRLEQKREEERRKKRDEEARRAGGAQSTMFSADDSEHKDGDEAEPDYKPIEILPPHTQMNEIVSEVGGHYSVLERCLLLASMQRAFLTASFPDDRNYTPLATLSATEARGPQSSGYRALQTSVVEECLYAAQRSTLRAFATGHVGTASAAANFCTDSLGRVLLSVLTRRAELGIDTLKPGEGLLPGQGGMGAAALAAVRDTALRGVGRAKDSTIYDEAAEKALVQQRITIGIARACANLNDMEVAIDYTRRLMDKFMSETQNYPRGHETEQLRMCIKGLDAVIDSFRANSDSSVNVLIEILSPRIRSIVNEAVGQESAVASGATSFLGGGTTTTTRTTARMNYELDDAGYERTQVSEGYITKLCSSLDELIEPLRIHLAPRMADTLILGILGAASRRLESSIKRSKFTALGAISLDSDVRYMVNFAKGHLDSSEISSNVALYSACNPLARLVQVSLLMNVDDLEDVLDLIASSKRKGNWDIKLDEAKAWLSLRVEFEGRKVNELLQVDE